MKKFLTTLFLVFVLAHLAFANTASKNPTSDNSVSGTWDGTAGSRYTVVNDHHDATADRCLCAGSS